MQARLAEALTVLGDAETAAREGESARTAFADLGAADDLRALNAMLGPQANPFGLSRRELEVLQCVCTGHTNRQIATTLTISEKTVARHLSNIFVKLDVASRTEATMVAFQNGFTGHSASRPGSSP